MRLYGAAVTKSGKAFHARVATTGEERSPSVARRVTGMTSVDDEDNRNHHHHFILNNMK